MCGICGKVSETTVSSAELRQMVGAISHRGPDDDGIYVNGRVGLANCRLSIIDLPNGRMPISNEDETIWITYNGEIYNYPALKFKLENLGHQFRTNSDTEVIVHLYEEYGEDCVHHLQGMFAFAIWDVPQQKLFMARDRLGQKPLFYSTTDDGLIFASEIKGILAAANIRRELDLEAMHYFLSLRFIPAPKTMFRGISKLPPAHCLIFQHGQLRTYRYWKLCFQNKLKGSEAELIEGLREKLSESVGRHLISDVPVGAFLSGGMDSSTIVALMARLEKQSFKTIAVGVREESFNELPYARMVANHCQTDHIEEQVNANMLHLIPEIVWHLDEPSDPIAACMYHAARLASQHVKVVLGGDGGDELFAGFDRYLGMQKLHHYATIPAVLRQRIISPALAVLPDSYAYKSLTQKLRWANDLSLIKAESERYAAATTYFRFSELEKHRLYSDSLGQQLNGLRAVDVIIDQFEQADAAHILDRMLYTDYVTRLPEHSLMLTDRMTMAHGLEARSPLLAHDLVEYVASFPVEMKIHGKRLKHILREAASPYLPPEILHREKQGFMFPIATWFRNGLYPFVSNFLVNSDLVKEGFFRRKQVELLLHEHRTGRVDHHVRLWMLLNLEVWFQIYIKEKPIDDLIDPIIGKQKSSRLMFRTSEDGQEQRQNSE